jgi:hypothetical protein
MLSDANTVPWVDWTCACDSTHRITERHLVGSIVDREVADRRAGLLVYRTQFASSQRCAHDLAQPCFPRHGLCHLSYISTHSYINAHVHELCPPCYLLPLVPKHSVQGTAVARPWTHQPPRCKLANGVAGVLLDHRHAREAAQNQSGKETNCLDSRATGTHWRKRRKWERNNTAM